MIVWAISDLHLPAHEKPMDIFGPHWANHFERIRDDWQQKVAPEDIVLLPGDLSWAMHLEEAVEDIGRVGALPGRKLILRGNHDYWWSAIGRVRRALCDGMYAIQNDAILLDGVLFGGSRGWTIPSDADHESDDARIFQRERQRLEMSLSRAREISADAVLIAMMHYPPRNDQQTGFSDILEKYGVSGCVYGHLHGAGLAGAIEGTVGGVCYRQVSCDGLGFTMARIMEF